MIRHFEEEIQSLKEKVLYMGSIVEKMISIAITALTERSNEGTSEIMSLEEKVNKLQMEIDDIAMKIIALHQPAANDLRFLIATMKINSDLERIGDQIVNITQTLEFYLQNPVITLPPQIMSMARIARSMVKDSLDAFVTANVELAQSILRRDDEVDIEKRDAFTGLLTEMTGSPDRIQPGVDLILISRNLERIADHATNIAEDVVYMAMGKDIRHPLLKEDS